MTARIGDNWLWLFLFLLNLIFFHTFDLSGYIVRVHDFVVTKT